MIRSTVFLFLLLALGVLLGAVPPVVAQEGVDVTPEMVDEFCRSQTPPREGVVSRGGRWNAGVIYCDWTSPSESETAWPTTHRPPSHWGRYVGVQSVAEEWSLPQGPIASPGVLQGAILTFVGLILGVVGLVRLRQRRNVTVSSR